MKKNASIPLPVSRKDFLKTGALSALFAGGLLIPGQTIAAKKASYGKAKNAIFLIVDGMSVATMSMGELMMNRKLGRTSHWLQLANQEGTYSGLMETSPLDAVVTDSAAAGSAFGCGHKVNVRSINMDPNNQPHKPILVTAKDAGKSTGLVTSTRVTHATPATFAANVEHRGNEDKIAEQYLERKVDVVLGGGNSAFDPAIREDGHDMYEDYRKAGYFVARNKSELNRYNSESPLLGVFTDGHLPYVTDHENTEELKQNVPSLSELTQIALSKLSQNPDGFVMQIEGGRVDHAGHGNDAAGLIRDQIEFDNCIGVVRRFVDANPETIVVITTDHGTGNPALNRSQNGYPATEDEFDSIFEFKHTNNWVLSGLDENTTISQIRERVEFASHHGISREETEFLSGALKGQRVSPYRMMADPRAVLGQIMANYTSVGFTGTSHTNDLVPVLAFGTGAEMLSPFIANTEVYDILTASVGIHTG